MRKTSNRSLPGSALAILRGLAAGLGVVASLVVPFCGVAPVAVARETESRQSSFHEIGEASRGRAPSLFGSELEAPGTLGVGRIARDVAKHLPSLDAVAKWLEPGAADLGFDKVRPVIARDNHQMIDFLKRGIVDLLSETPISALHFVEEAGASIILRERRMGHDEYRSIILVGENSPIRSLADLAGRRIAFEDAGSTTAFLLPLAAIKRAGLRTVEIDDAAAAPVEGAVSYFFARSETSILTAVLRGVADAGAMSDEDWNDFRHDRRVSTSGLRVLHESEPVPRAFVLTGPTLTTKQRDGLRELMLTMANDRRGLEALDRYDDVDGFDTIGSSLERDIAALDETRALVREELK